MRGYIRSGEGSHQGQEQADEGEQDRGGDLELDPLGFPDQPAGRSSTFRWMGGRTMMIFV